MCIRDRVGGVSGGLWVSNDITQADPQWQKRGTYFENIAIGDIGQDPVNTCLLYTSDAADERSSVDLGGRRIIKQKQNIYIDRHVLSTTQ